MIPYVELRPLALPGGLVAQPFGLLVLAGLVAGTIVCCRRGVAAGIPMREMLSSLWWAVVPGFLVAHATSVLLHRTWLLQDRGLAVLLDLSGGISSYGGFFGGFAFLYAHLRWTRRPVLQLLDIVVEGLVVGWIFGRLGCAFAHDHPGSLTSFPLAVAYPGGTRHDLGLYELVFTVAVLLPAVLRARGAPGTKLAVACLVYAPARFLLDFLRATDLPDADPRWWGLTMGQYGSLLALLAGGWLAARAPRRLRRGAGGSC